MDRRLSPRFFEPEATYVAARNMDLGDGVELTRGDIVPVGDGAGECSVSSTLRLWMSGWVIKQEDFHPTPVVGDVNPADIIVDDTKVEQLAQDFEAGDVKDETAVLEIKTGEDTAAGTSGADTMTGTAGDDTITGEDTQEGTQGAPGADALQPEHGVTTSPLGGGYYGLTVSWDPALLEKVRGKDAAAARAAELMAQAPQAAAPTE